MTVDSLINGAFAKLADVSEGFIFYSIDLGVPNAAGDPLKLPLILVWLAAASIFFTFYYGFINLRYFKHSVEVALNKYSEPGADGQLSSFQALMTSLSGTVGLGNIAGVAVAITVGGPGAALWMAIMGLFSMSTKFVEVTLGVKYRHHHDPAHPEEISGGPMYYLRDGLANRNIPYLGPILAGMFALACIAGAIGGGSMFQTNQTYMQFLNVTGGADASWLAGKGWLFGLAMAAMVGVVIIGGIQSIAGAASKIVPLMAGLYLLTGFVVIGMNIGQLPEALGVIVTDAFSFKAGIGGFLGAVLAGVQRATFSNEAGMGSSAIVHATARTSIPAKQGIAGMMGSFVDTIVVCMMTALMIVVSGVYKDDSLSGVELPSAAMESAVSWFPYVLAVCVFLFAYSTLITWYYYAEKALTFLFGEKAWLTMSFKLVFCFFVVVGGAAELGNVIRLSDALFLSMGIPNIIGLYLLAPEVKRDLKEYLKTLDKKREVSLSSG